LTLNPKRYLQKIQPGCMEPACKLSDEEGRGRPWTICNREITAEGWQTLQRHIRLGQTDKFKPTVQGTRWLLILEPRVAWSVPFYGRNPKL
jgi:hypothetical protein